MTIWQEYITENCTEGQKEAILARQPLIVVSAGAGAGKTHTLAQRFAYLIAEDPTLRMEQMLVLTFTVKAAQEMRDRIEQQLKDLYEKYREQIPHLKERILQIDDANISTLDSFAMKITREAGLSLDIDPTFTIASDPFQEAFWDKFSRALDEMSEDKMKQLAVSDEIWKERAAELFAFPNFSKFVSEYTPQKLTEIARKAISLYSNISQAADAQWLWNFSNKEQLEEYQSQASYATLIEDTWDTWHKLFAEFDRAFTGAAKSDAPILAFRAQWIDEAKTPENMRAFATQLAGNTVINRVTAKLPVAFFTEHFNLSPTDYRNKLAEQLAFCRIQTEEEQQICSMLNKTAALGWHCFEQEKQTANCLSIQDLMLYATQVISSSEEYRSKYRYIMVDEFQDTNPLQDALLSKLWGGLDSENSNSLFIVGDLKQSIYRFRHAKPALFSDYIRLAQQSGDKAKYISLCDNFRSAENLLGVINNTFGKLWKDGMGALKVPYEELNYPETSKALPTDDAVDVLTTAKKSAGKSDGEKKLADDARYELYLALAQYIKEYIAHNSELSWKDFTMLVPTRTAYRQIERAFDYAQIPYALCSAKDYYGRDEIIVLINLLNLLANPDDAFALSVWIASPFSKLAPQTAENLLCEAKQAKGKNLSERLLSVIQEHEPQILTQLEKFRNIAKLRGIPAVLMELQRDTSALQNYAPALRRRVSVNLAKLIEAAREYEQTKGNSLSGCAAYLDKAVASGQQKEEIDLVDEEQDKLRVMTIHASKGLQFNVTILAETDSKPPSDTDTLLVSPTLGIIVNKLPDFISKENIATAASPWHKKIEADATAEEKLRCWYVGMTRAKRKLVLCGIENSTQKGTTRGNFFGTFTELNDENSSQIKELRATDFNVTQTNAAQQKKETNCMPLPIQENPMLSRITASAYATLSWCPYAYRRSFRQGIQMEWENEGNGETTESGNKFGTLIHTLIKQWDFNEQSIDKLIANAHFWLTPELCTELSNDNVVTEAKKILCKLSQSPEIIQLAQFGDKVKKEVSFRVKNGELLMVGSIDCYWQDSEGYHIRDWKTGASSEMTEAYYKPQLDFYAAALWLYKKLKSEIQDLTIDAGLVHLNAPDIANTHIYTDTELEQIAHNILITSQLACCNSFEPATDRCDICPWKSECDKAQ